MMRGRAVVARQVHTLEVGGSNPSPATDHQNLHTMTSFFLFEFLLKAVMLILGILAWQGMKWAFVAFLIVAGVVLVADIALAVIFHFYDENLKSKKPKK